MYLHFFLYMNMGRSKRISSMTIQLSDTPMMLQRKIDFTLELPLIKFERAHPPCMCCINYDFVRGTPEKAPKTGDLHCICGSPKLLRVLFSKLDSSNNPRIRVLKCIEIEMTCMTYLSSSFLSSSYVLDLPH